MRVMMNRRGQQGLQRGLMPGEQPIATMAEYHEQLARAGALGAPLEK
jgi:hypothetical protein